MTFEEWCGENPDLVKDAREEWHPCGQSWGELVRMCVPGAAEHIESRLRSLYDEAVQRDNERLAKWNEAMK